LVCYFRQLVKIILIKKMKISLSADIICIEHEFALSCPRPPVACCSAPPPL
jgi:hypothetical protein